MEFGIAKVIDWNGEEGLLEDEQGEVIRFTYEDINPRDLDEVSIGTVVVVTESGFLELTSQAFSHYVDGDTDQMKCIHMDVKNGFCEDCGEKAD